MRFRNTYPLSLSALLGCVLACTIAAGAPATSSAVDIVATTDPGAVRVSGTAAGIGHVQVALYASFATDVPVVLLRKSLIPVDAAGRFEATLPIAPATFTGAVITAIVQTPAGLAVGRGSYTITAAAATDPARP
jgi:hypothetical protein